MKRLLLAFALLLPRAAVAETWVPVGGPTGGDARELAADPRDPRVVYLGTSDGLLYRSDDAGASWRRLAPGFPLRGMSLDEIAVSPTGDVYVGYWEVAGIGGGVAKSTDGGRTFVLLGGIAGESVRALALAPSNPDVVWVGTISGVFCSHDAGATWKRSSPQGHAGLRNVESVAVDPADPSVVYAGTWHLSWKTADGGRNWGPAHAGIIDDSDIFTLSVDRRNRQTVYATACSGIYRSADAGARWAKLRGIPASGRRTRSFAQDPERPDTLYAGTTEGLWVSEDNASSWRVTTDKDIVVNSVLVLPGGGVLIGTEGAGVLRSTDGGRSWSASNDGFTERFVSRLVFDARGNRVLAAVALDRYHGGVLTAPRVEGPWSRLAPGLEGREVLSVAIAEQSVLAGTDDGVFLATEGRWQRLPTLIAGLDAHPRVADVAAGPDHTYLAATSDGLLRSADAGRSWERRTLGAARSVTALAASPRDAHLVLAATPLGVFRSEDAGATWAGPASFAETTIRSLALLPADDRVVFAMTAKGLYKSVDRGQSWYRRGGGLPLSDITSLAMGAEGRVLYATDFTLGGVYRSDDAGDAWRRVATDGLLSDRVWAVALDPAAPGRLLAAMPSGGLQALVTTPPPQSTAAP
jgi:photosystem II stability/assembly factor-like uncharacterized protein